MDSNIRVFREMECFEVRLDLIVPEKERDFPLYLFLVRDDRLVLRYAPRQRISEQDLATHESNGLASFWCPVDFRAAWDRYLGRTPVPANVVTFPAAASNPDPDVIGIIDDGSLTEEQKNENTRHASSDIIGLLTGLTDGACPEECVLALDRCTRFTDGVMQDALAHVNMHSVYYDLVFLTGWMSENAILVSSLSVIFGIAYGFTNKAALADLALGGLIRDLGMLDLSENLWEKPRSEYTPEEREVFEHHVRQGAEVLRKYGITVNENVSAIIRGHHEHFDGSGFPYRLAGEQISPSAQIVAFSELMADMIMGRIDGKRRSPGSAFDYVAKIQGKHRAIRRFDPEVFSRIVTFAERARLTCSRKNRGVARDGAKDNRPAASGPVGLSLSGSGL